MVVYRLTTRFYDDDRGMGWVELHYDNTLPEIRRIIRSYMGTKKQWHELQDAGTLQLNGFTFTLVEIGEGDA